MPSSTELRSAQVIATAITTKQNLDTADGGSCAIELWRGIKTSWQIANEDGYLYIRNNYNGTKLEAYEKVPMRIAPNETGAAITNLSLGTEELAINDSYSLYTNGQIYFELTENKIGEKEFCIGDKTGNYISIAGAGLNCWNGTMQIQPFGGSVIIGRSSDESYLVTTVNHGSLSVVKGLGLANTDGTSGLGISLYGGPAAGKPSYGIMFAETGTFGGLQNTNSTYGISDGTWATYLTMNDNTGRGWIFQRGNTSVAAINGYGTLVSNVPSASHLAGAQGMVAIDMASPAGHVMLARIKSTNGNFVLGTYNTDMRIEYITNALVASGTNGASYSVSLIKESGATRLNKLSINIDNEDYTLNVNGTTKLNGNTYVTSGALEIMSTKDVSGVVYGGGGFHSGTANIILRGHETTGVSSIVFLSTKGATSINTPSDCGFIQFHPYGVTAQAIGTNGTLGTSGESNKLVIGVNNDSDDELWLQTPAKNGLRHVIGAGVYTIVDANNYPDILDGRYVNVTGDTMTGCLHMKPSANGSYNENIRMHPSPSNWSAVVFCGDDNTGDSGVSTKTWGIYTNNGDFFISKGGSNSGTAYLHNTGGAWILKGSMQPSDNNTYDMGASTKAFRYVYSRQLRSDTVDGCSSSGITVIPYVPYSKIEPNHDTQAYYKALIKWICANYPNDGRVIYQGSANPNSASQVTIRIYSNETKDANGYPQYADGMALELGGTILRFGFSNYNWYWYSSSLNTHNHDGTYVKRSGDTMTGPLTFANGTCNVVGDDCGMGDINSAGTLAFQGKNGTTNLWLVQYGAAWSPSANHATISYDGTRVSCDKPFLGAVWNDYAEYRTTNEHVKPGQCVVDLDDGSLQITTARLQPGAQVVSDTFGFAIGETEDTKTPLAVSGRVLVYPYQARENYHAGQAVCSAPNGTVDIMTREEIREYPDCIIGIVSEIPAYETWGTGNVSVDGRIWIKIK